MIDRSFIEKIVDLATPVLVTVSGREYSTQQIHPVKDPVMPGFKVSTLSSIVDYIVDNFDEANKLVIHVESEASVKLFSPIFGKYRQRDEMLQAQPSVKPFQFGTRMSIESFIISMQALFIADETTAQILKIVGNITDNATRNHSDDGVTQSVTAKSGIVRVENTPLPNPVMLRPYRTFIEIEQPASRFVFRMSTGHNGPECMLVEADGGAWKMAAIDSISSYFKEHLQDLIAAEKVHILA